MKSLPDLVIEKLLRDKKFSGWTEKHSFFSIVPEMESLVVVFLLRK
jgi:hypothetical protein